MRFRRVVTLLCAAPVLAVAACSNTTPSPDDASRPARNEARELGDIEKTNWFRSACSLPMPQLRRIERGYVEGRSPDVMYVTTRRNFFNGFAHSGPWEHVQEVPLVLYGPGYIKAQGSISVGREVTVADLAPTFAELMGREMPRSDGNVLTEALEEGRDEPPLLIVTVVWDGAGTNVLERWPDAWPELATVIGSGTAFEGATVGSSPSVTPPVHATIGTGVFPNRHGIVDIPQREGAEIKDSWDGTSPKNLTAPSLADVYDLATGNEAVIGMFAERAWQLGMIGRGAFHEGGDRDIGVLTDKESDGRLITNEEYYELPEGLEDRTMFEKMRQTVDAEDGALDDTWMDNEILDKPELLPWTPVWTLYQTEVIKNLLRRENFGADDITDLFYVNYKQIDHVGHRWTLPAPEMPVAIEYSDTALAELVDFLNAEMGDQRWVLALTADHGAQPPAEDTQGWMIDISRLTEAVERDLGVSEGEVIEEDRPVGMWLTPESRGSAVPYAEMIATFLTGYTIADDLEEGETVPDHLAPEDRVFAAAFPMEHLPEILACAESRP